ncbi:MAG TPA: hypothetical protein VLH15_06835 [Dehalococcoidales bacterium]|nr:hypothetical protein [Dehalococcoidales bacterium]
MRDYLPHNFNDLLCLILIGLIGFLWIMLGRKWLDLPAEVTGALIVTWTLLVQHYFRKKNPGPEDPKKK